MERSNRFFLAIEAARQFDWKNQAVSSFNLYVTHGSRFTVDGYTEYGQRRDAPLKQSEHSSRLAENSRRLYVI